MKLNQWAVFSLIALSLSGCASYAPDTRRSVVNTAVSDRVGVSLPHEFSYAAAPLSGTLTLSDTIRAALRHNLFLQAALEDLNIATAQEVQAGLLVNPAVTGQVLFDGGSPTLDFGVGFALGNLLTRNRRMLVAAADRQRVEAQTIDAIVRIIAETRVAVVELWARQQSIDVLQQIAVARDSAAKAARILSRAGNLTAGDFALYQRQAVESQLALGQAQLAQLDSVEGLANTVGVPVDADVSVVLERTAPDSEPAADAFVARALEKSLMLAAERERIRALGVQVGLAQVSVWLDHLETEAALEREDGEASFGLGASFSLPLFDGGKARTGAARAALEAAELRYRALAFSVANRARAVLGLMDIAKTAADSLTPMLVSQTEEEFDFETRQLNAMQIGPLRLIDARVRQLENRLTAIDMQRLLALARIQADALLAGVNVSVADAFQNFAPASAAAGEDHS